MGCSPSAGTHTPRKGAQHMQAHGFPCEEVSGLRVHAENRKRKIGGSVHLVKHQATSRNPKKTVLRLGTARQIECFSPRGTSPYDSVTHSVDAYDLFLMKQGHAVPVHGQAPSKAVSVRPHTGSGRTPSSSRRFSGAGAATANQAEIEERWPRDCLHLDGSQ
mmetsp:Transcript_48750/g.113827  ORF Transcript_48750/g.113827 Transcript_48750/m.113827 type:complete len:162 (-) Transcript_48750:6-491(-)